MNLNLITAIPSALVKTRLGVGRLTGLERTLLAQFALPDRVPTMLVATNIEPFEIDPAYNYRITTERAEANLELFDKVRSRFHADTILVPAWMGLLVTGAGELGTKFHIEERRVPYAVEHPIHSLEDVARIEVPSEARGYLKMYFDINREAQRRYPDTLIYPIFDGPWDLAMLLRGDKHLPWDLRLHKDYVESDDPRRKDKIRQAGDPDLYPAIMELTTRLTIQHIRLAKGHGLDLMGSVLVDQFATQPILGMADFVRYVLPYIERVWEASGRKLTIGYMYTSPADLEKAMSHPLLRRGAGVAGFTNYIFPQTPEGIPLPEYDSLMLEMAKRMGRSYNYIIPGKFLRDATESEIEALIQRVCGMATRMRARMSVAMASIPPGTDLEKINLVLGLAERYGRYSNVQ